MNLFVRVNTQWRTDSGAFIGLDYTPLLLIMGQLDLGKERFIELLDEIRAIESGALEELRAKND